MIRMIYELKPNHMTKPKVDNLNLKITLSKNLHWRNKHCNGSLSVKPSFTVGHLMFRIRALLLNVSQSEALFCFFDDIHLYPMSETIITIFEKHQSNNILAVTVTCEDCFGGHASGSEIYRC